MLPFIGAGISLISGAVSNLFTGEGRERRQAKRLERRQKRAARQAARVTIKQPAARVPYYPPKAQPTQADIKRVRKPAGEWIQENWYFIAGGAAALLLVIWFTTKKKKVGRRRKKSNPSNPSSSSSKSNPGSRSKKKNSPAHVMKQWQKAKAGGSKMGLKAAWAKFG